MIRPTCSHCGFPKGKQKTSGVIGRPRVTNFVEVYALLKKGFSFSEIAKKYNVSKGAIQNAIRVVKFLESKK